MIKIYNAGPLFTEAEIYQRRLEADLIKELLEKLNQEYSIFNPIDVPKSDISSVGIFDVDYDAIKLSNTFFFDLANMDTGTLVELGIVIERLQANKSIKIYPVISDFRVSNESNGFESSIGFNSFVIGALKSNEINIYLSFKDALEQFKKDILLNKHDFCKVEFE